MCKRQKDAFLPTFIKKMGNPVSILVEDLILINRETGASTMKRIDPDTLSSWLEEYSLGELWRKNIIE